MERTTLYFDAALKRRLKEAARHRKTTEAALVREAVELYLSSSTKGPQLRAVGRSSDGGVARDVDRALGDLGFGRK